MGCKKPNLKVPVPWEETPSHAHNNQSPIQHPLNSLATEFTEEYTRAQHGSLISGLTGVYRTLEQMQYLCPSEILQPTHPQLRTNELASIGYEPETIALLRYLPHLDFKEEIIYPWNYLSAVGDSREVLWENEYDIAPWAIRLTRCR